eukprot:TRINITY_DN4311_c0_g1_i1.p1 TRINITY_DN4311_c0_g1~~TRINITY_DN4311_c0_g1_i1.p1  ORF type:complete len:870 (-),score=149.67 TRINITY_DN4311_c0_g1_i1:99-2708(-)
MAGLKGGTFASRPHSGNIRHTAPAMPGDVRGQGRGENGRANQVSFAQASDRRNEEGYSDEDDKMPWISSRSRRHTAPGGTGLVLLRNGFEDYESDGEQERPFWEDSTGKEGIVSEEELDHNSELVEAARVGRSERRRTRAAAESAAAAAEASAPSRPRRPTAPAEPEEISQARPRSQGYAPAAHKPDEHSQVARPRNRTTVSGTTAASPREEHSQTKPRRQTFAPAAPEVRSQTARSSSQTFADTASMPKEHAQTSRPRSKTYAHAEAMPEEHPQLARRRSQTYASAEAMPEEHPHLARRRSQTYASAEAVPEEHPQLARRAMPEESPQLARRRPQTARPRSHTTGQIESPDFRESPRPWKPLTKSQSMFLSANDPLRYQGRPSSPSSIRSLSPVGGRRASWKEVNLEDSLLSPSSKNEAPDAFELSLTTISATASPEKFSQEQQPIWVQVPTFRPAAVAALADSGARSDRCLVDNLLCALRKLRGTSLRAWRRDFDTHGVGWVSQAEFSRACRFYGCSPEGIWSGCRSGSNLKFWELDHEEATNLEAFEQVLWIRTGFDLSKAWAFLDPNNRTALSMQEFVRGCRSLGFQGNPQIIFRGLDHQGQGRLSRHDFDYLQKVSSTSSQLQNFTPETRALRKWVAEEFGEPAEFLKRLNLVANITGGWAQALEPLDVREFARRLAALGFPGDPGEVALQVAGSRPSAAGTSPASPPSPQAEGISADRVCAALFGVCGKHTLRRHEGSLTGLQPPSPRSPSSRSPRPSSASSAKKKKQNPIRKAKWDSSSYPSDLANRSRPACLRTYFSVPSRHPHEQIRKVSSQPALLSKAPPSPDSPMPFFVQVGKAGRDRSQSPEDRRVRPGQLPARRLQ